MMDSANVCAKGKVAVPINHRLIAQVFGPYLHKKVESD